MKKLYIFNEKKQCYYYDEAWISNNEVTEHIGRLGTEGKVKTHPLDATLSEDEIDGFGTPEDLDKRHSLESRMGETLGWTGLGHCDGGSIGSGTMEVCCFVVDFDLAKNVIEEDLKGTEFADYNRIYNENA